MLHLIKGDTGSDKTSLLLNEIKRTVERGERCYLIVPEQQTVVYEAMFAEGLPQCAPLFFEVINFSRLANTVFRKYGGLSYNYSTSAQRALVMWRALGELLPTLHDSRGELEMGRVRKMLSAISELKACSVSADELTRASEQTDDISLKNKLQDLSAVYTLYSKLLNEKYADAGDDLTKTCEILRKHKFFEGATVFIDSFTSFTEQQYRIIAEMTKQCDVTVTLPIPHDSERRLCFEEIKGCEKRLHIIAAKGIEVTYAEEDDKGGECGLLSHVAKNLFLSSRGEQSSFTGEERGRLAIVEAPTPFAEADYVAADIAKKVYGGARYKDFSIIARDATRYAGVIDSALRKYDIPFFMSVKTDVSAYAPIKLIYSAYSICSSSFNRGDVITYMKCGLCGISDCECDEFELYTEQWNINGRSFTESDDWNMSRNGYSDTECEGDAEFLARINKTKNAVIAPLVALCDSIGGKVTVTEHCHALYRFLTQIGLQQTLQEHGKLLCERGEREEGELTLRLYQLICDSLDTLIQTLPDTCVSAESFLQLLKIVFNETDIGRIPASNDAVTIGSADMLRASTQNVYLFGVNEGEFPATVSDKSFFTQNDRELLSDAGIMLEQDLSEKASRELFCFYRAFRSATGCVTALYSLTDTSFGASKRASVLTDIARIAGENAEEIKYDTLDERDLIWRKESALSVIGKMAESSERDTLCSLLAEYPEYQSRVQRASAPISNTSDKVSTELMKKIYPGDISSTQSRLERYAKCSFSYFCQYVLRLDENRKAKIDFAAIGTFVHAVLEKLFLHLDKNEKRLSELTDGEINTLVEKISSDYIKAICPKGREQSPRMIHLFQRLKKSAIGIVKNLQNEFSQSEFIPRFFEFKISDSDKSCSSIEIKTKSGKRIKLHGVVDRIDTYRDGDDVYVRVVDYKSGPKKFSADLIEKGLNLQMLIYLFSIWKSDSAELKEKFGCAENGKILPAGILYMPTKVDNLTVNSFGADTLEKTMQKAFVRNGLLLENEQVLRAMEKNLEQKYIPIKMTKTGNLSPQNALASLAEMGELLEQTKTVISELCDDLQSGDAKACPLEVTSASLPCDYCSFRAICRKY